MSAHSARLSVLESARELRPLACVAARFASDTSGTLAITFSLMAVALLLFIGGGIDLARWLDARNKTMAAMDAAVLAAGRALQTNGGNTVEAIAVAQIYYKNAVASRIKIKSDNISFKVSDDGTDVMAIGNATIVTPFMSFGGVGSLPLVNQSGDESSQAVIKIGANAKDSFGISLILDMSGSMNEGTKLADLQPAAKDLVNIVVWDHQNEYYSKVAIVSYATAVQVKSYAQQVQGIYTAGTCSTPTCQYFKFTNANGQYKTNQIGTCVPERMGVQAFSDAAPTSAPVGKNYESLANPCISAPIVPLTNDKSVLISSIDSLSAGGSTGGQIGIAWGWYMLSPNWAYLWPAGSHAAGYGTPHLHKIAILMTDGEYNSGYSNGVISLDSGTGSGSPSDHINCNAPNGNSYVQSLKLCTAMKVAGVTVYTVGINVIDSQSAVKLLSECASEPANFYNATNGNSLQQAFRDIALKVSTLYPAK